MIYSIRIRGAHRHRDTYLEFLPGFTVLYGANESGKSSIIELGVLFALFGSAALRTSVSDYKGLKVETEFGLRGRRYRVERTTTDAKLFEVGSATHKVTGTTAVNQAILQAFGYNLDVFNIAHACNQGDVERLGRMLPTARKQSFNLVTGGARWERIAEYAASQATTRATEIQAVRKYLHQPTAPEVGRPARPLEELISAARSARTTATRRSALTAVLAHALPAEPREPKAPCEDTASSLDAHERQRTAVNQRIQELRASLANPPATPAKPVEPCPETSQALHDHEARRRTLVALAASLADLPEAQLTASELATALAEQTAYKAFAAAQRQLKSMKPPAVAQALVLAAEAQWQAHMRWNEKLKLLDQGEHVCPACEHHWPVATASLADYADVVETARPDLTQAEIAKLRSEWNAWDAGAEHRAELTAVPRVGSPLVEAAEIEDAQRCLALADRRAAALRAETELAATADRSTDLTARLSYEAAMASYQRDLATWEAWERRAVAMRQEGNSLREQLRTLPDRSADLAARRNYEASHQAWCREHQSWADAKRRRHDAEAEIQTLPASAAADADRLEADYSAAREAKALWDEYDRRSGEYQTAMAKIASTVAEMEEYRAGREAALETRDEEKAYLAPSLNFAASRMLSAMTGGVRTDMTVDEDFEVLVDGTKLAGLSGSGKAVANLALRFALGQVLTSAVFPVVILDEIDASMDATRAADTMECVRNLKNCFAQVLVITHRQIPADHEFLIAA